MQQILMHALLDDFAPFNDEYPIGVADGRKAMRNENHRPPAADLRQIALDNAFGFVIERARGLVENQNPRVGDQGAGDGGDS